VTGDQTLQPKPEPQPPEGFPPPAGPLEEEPPVEAAKVEINFEVSSELHFGQFTEASALGTNSSNV